MAQKKSFFRRLAWSIFGLLFFCIAASIAAVVLLRWVNPPYSAFMAETQLAAWAKHDRTYVFRHRWVDLKQITPNLPLAVVASEDQKFPAALGLRCGSHRESLRDESA